MRIDNFVYTKESFQEAKQLLAPDGVVFIKFQVDRPWLGKRLVEMLTQVFGKPPSLLWQPRVTRQELRASRFPRRDKWSISWLLIPR